MPDGQPRPGGLSGRTVIVTGGAGGIGRAMVHQFTREGAYVIAADLDEDALNALADEVAGVSLVQGDVSSASDAERIVEAAEGRLDVLCNNAGISDGTLVIDETSIADWERCLAVNLTGAFLMSRLAVRTMLGRGGGCIVNTASVAGLRGGRGGAAYVAAKHGLVGLTKNVASTLGEQGIRCNAICPGAVDVDMRTLAPRSARGVQRMLVDPSRPSSPGAPEDIAAVAVMLARDESRLINGAVIPVDDGWTAY